MANRKKKDSKDDDKPKKKLTRVEKKAAPARKNARSKRDAKPPPVMEPTSSIVQSRTTENIAAQPSRKVSKAPTRREPLQKDRSSTNIVEVKKRVREETPDEIVESASKKFCQEEKKVSEKSDCFEIQEFVTKAPETISASQAEPKLSDPCSSRTEKSDERSHEELVAEAPKTIAASWTEPPLIEPCSSSSKKSKLRLREESSDEEQENLEPSSKKFSHDENVTSSNVIEDDETSSETDGSDVENPVTFSIPVQVQLQINDISILSILEIIQQSVQEELSDEWTDDEEDFVESFLEKCRQDRDAAIAKRQPEVEDSPMEIDTVECEETKDKKEEKIRCATCKRKLGLTAIQCRCGGFYCAKHRYSNEHDCTFDYRELGREEIRRNNPLIGNKKIEKF